MKKIYEAAAIEVIRLDESILMDTTSSSTSACSEFEACPAVGCTTDACPANFG